MIDHLMVDYVMRDANLVARVQQVHCVTVFSYYFFYHVFKIDSSIKCNNNYFKNTTNFLLQKQPGGGGTRNLLTDSPSSTTPSSVDNNYPFNNNSNRPFNTNNSSSGSSSTNGGYHQGSLGRTNLAYNDNDSSAASAPVHLNQGGPPTFNDLSSKGTVGHQQLLAEGQKGRFGRSEQPLVTNTNNNSNNGGVSSNFVNTEGVVYQPQNTKRSNQQPSMLQQQQSHVS